MRAYTRESGHVRFSTLRVFRSLAQRSPQSSPQAAQLIASPLVSVAQGTPCLIRGAERRGILHLAPTKGAYRAIAVRLKLGPLPKTDACLWPVPVRACVPQSAISRCTATILRARSPTKFGRRSRFVSLCCRLTRVTFDLYFVSQVLSAPTVSNIIAMAALGYHDGLYTFEQIGAHPPALGPLPACHDVRSLPCAQTTR